MLREEFHAWDRGGRQALLLDGDREGASQRSELAVDGRVRLAGRPTLVLVRLDTGSGPIASYIAIRSPDHATMVAATLVAPRLVS